MMRVFGLVVMSFWIPQIAWARTVNSCLPDYTAAQTFIYLQNSRPKALTVPLTAMGPHGAFTSKVQMDAYFTSAGVQLSFHFDDAFQGVSLPYNLYSVLIVQDGHVVSWQDFTSACRDPGIGFFPGQHVNLPLIKLPTPTGNFQIMVWGRL